VEHERIRQIPCGAIADPPEGVAFLDGTQRWIVERWLGIHPVVRAHVAAAVLRRVGGMLTEVASDLEEFRVVARHRVSGDLLSALEDDDTPVLDAGGDARAHPLLDLRLAALRVERRRAALERRLAAEYLAAGARDWLVVDGSIEDLAASVAGGTALLGLVKSHDTQFLDGADLKAALTLPEAVATASEVSRWLLAERTPLAAPDERWDRLLYPIRRVETYLNAQAGGWW
jgi:hypothetical protein